MKRLGMLTLICSFVFTTLQTSNARADAETMGSRCVNQVHATLDRVESRVADRTTATVTLIERYLAVGRVEAATLAATSAWKHSTTGPAGRPIANTTSAPPPQTVAPKAIQTRVLDRLQSFLAVVGLFAICILIVRAVG